MELHLGAAYRASRVSVEADDLLAPRQAGLYREHARVLVPDGQERVSIPEEMPDGRVPPVHVLPGVREKAASEMWRQIKENQW